MAMRCKMRCQSVEKDAHGGANVQFSAQYDPSIPEDVNFNKATPWGEIVMHIDNPRAVDRCVEGKAYYVDFSPAD